MCVLEVGSIRCLDLATYREIGTVPANPGRLETTNTRLPHENERAWQPEEDPPPLRAIRHSDDIISTYQVTEYRCRNNLQSPGKQLKLQFPLSSTRGADNADITSLEVSATGLKYLPFSEMPDPSVFIVNGVLWSWGIDVLVSLHYYYPAFTRSWETDRRCVHFTHTPKVFARVTSTLQNVNYFLVGNVDDGAYIERQTGMQYGVL